MIVKNKTKAYYNKMGRDYLNCWSSLAKKDINNFELDFVNKTLKSFKKNNALIKILEIGAGPGRIAKEILNHDNIEYYGLDISEEMARVFKENTGKNNKIKQFIVSDISTTDPFKNVKFDCIVAMRTLYYNRNWQEIVGKLSNKLNNNGKIIFCMLNKYSTAILGKTQGGDLVGHYTSKNELLQTLKKNNFVNIEITGYARMPDVIYDFCRTKLLADILKCWETILRLFLGKILFARMFYVVARKI